MFLLVATVGRAASVGAALSQHRQPNTSQLNSIPIPHVVSFREVTGRGLLVRTWINDAGPFNFAIDTGAGAILVSRRIADETHVTVANRRPSSIAGLSGVKGSAYSAKFTNLAIGDADNYLPAKGEALIVDGLPGDLDGVLDPTEALAPLGYEIDLPRRQLSAFDPRLNPLAIRNQPADGTVVRWISEPNGRRPFVMLDNGERALLDTGSALGLAIRDREAQDASSAHAVWDIGGGRITTRRVTSRNVSIGSLHLQRIPTDLISGAEVDAPVLLGLAALRPFRLRFDPSHRLIEIAPDRSGRGF